MEFLWLLAILFALSGPVGAIFGIIAFTRLQALQTRLDALQRGQGAAAPAQPAPSAPVPTPAQPAEAPKPDRAAASPEPEATARPAPAPQAALQERKPALAGLEQALARSWLVWLGAATLALGGAFLVKFALDAGWFGPWARICAAVLAGAAMLGAGEVLRRRPGAFGPSGSAGKAAPAALSGAGIITLYGAVYAAYGLYALIPAPLAFAGLALCAAGALALAILHGVALAIFGLAGAFLAPLPIGSHEPNAAGLFTYVLVVCAAGFGAARLLKRHLLSILAVAGGTLWPLLFLASGTGGGVAALSAYLPLFLAAALLAGQDQARTPLPAGRVLRDWGRPPAGLLSAWLAAAGASLVAVLLIAYDRHGETGLASLAVLSVLALSAAWRREGYGPVPLLLAAGSVLALFLWPESAREITGPDEQLAVFMGETSPPALRFLPAAAGFAALFGLGGWFALHARTVKAPLAAVSAGTPVLILAAAYVRMNGFETEPVWALAALALVALGSLACLRLARREGGFDAVPGTVSAYALGVSAAAAIAAGAALDQMWMSAAFSIEALAAAWLWRRFGAPGLPLAALVFGALAVIRLLLTGEVFTIELGAWPILNGLIVGYGLSALALWGAARLLREGGLPADGAAVQSLTAGALVLGIAFVNLQLRHLLNDGDVAGFGYSVMEIGLQTSAWLASAAAIRWQLGPTPAIGPRLVEYGTAGLAGLHALFGLALLANPWWGEAAASVSGPAFLNGLLLAYALPGACAAGYAIVLGRQGARQRARIAGGFAVTLLGLWILLALRQAFAGWAGMDSRPVGEAEAYAYSAAGLVYAALLLAGGVMRRQASLRYAGLGLLVAVTLKVFLIDMASLEGVWRGLSFLGLGAALVALSLFYQRILPRLSEPGAPA